MVGLFKHTKSGGLYLYECCALIESTLTPSVVYMSYSSKDENFPIGTKWVRPIDQFLEKFTAENKDAGRCLEEIHLFKDKHAQAV